MRRLHSTLIAFMTSISLIGLSAAALAGVEQRAKPTVTGPEKASAGKQFDLFVSIEIEPGYHIQANDAKDPYIPTKIEVTAPAGYKVGAPVFPASKVISSAGEKLAVFDSKISVKIPVTPPATARGSQEFSVKVKYQACNDQACDPPTSATTTGKVTFAPGPKKPAVKAKGVK